MSKVVDGILKDLKNIPESLRKKMKGTDKNKLIRMSIPYAVSYTHLTLPTKA